MAADWRLLFKILSWERANNIYAIIRIGPAIAYAGRAKDNKMWKSHLLQLSSSLLLLLPFVFILQSFLLFHGRLASNPIFDTHNKASQNLLNAELKTLRQAIHPQVSVIGSSGSKFLRKVPSLEYTPRNMTRQERIRWFQDNLQRFTVLHSDSIAAQFSAKVEAFLKPCKLRFYITWLSQIESFGYRERLSMESVFKWNPSCCLLIISRTTDSEAGRQILVRIMHK